MREPRNPFRLLASERITYSSTFLRLFAPGALDILKDEQAFSGVKIFRSSSGGGKTSIFRMFSPSSLLTLHELRATEDHKDLYHRLSGLDVFSEDGPKVLGVYLSCTRNYASLDDLHFNRGYSDRLLFSLLNSRIIIATLREALIMKKLKYPDDLSKLQIHHPKEIDIPTTIPTECNGIKLHNWASNIEKRISNLIDSFAEHEGNSFGSQDALYSLFLLRPECISINGEPISNQILIMLDDIHKLTQIQREKVLDQLINLRLPTGIWLSERLESLPLEQLVISGATQIRDYDEIKIEEFWRPNGSSKRFENTLTNIADRRVTLNPDFATISFSDSLYNSLDGIEWNNIFLKACKIVSNRIRKKVDHTKLYQKWISNCENLKGTPRERATQWRVLEILIDRDLKKGQQRLLDIPIPVLEFEEKNMSQVKIASELFLSLEFHIPYYFGFSALAKLSSSNIEQFLELASGLFEEAMAAKLLHKSFVLYSTRQENILKKSAKRRWDNIPKHISNGSDVKSLLNFISQFCQLETYQRNAPYAPGVTGIAISMNDREKLINSNTKQNPDYERLKIALSSCISNNLLEASIDKRQGKKGGQKWMILYLNRILCLNFGLPLQYGGFRHRTLNELCNYLDPNYKISKKYENLIIYD